jgi:hypothetical protein
MTVNTRKKGRNRELRAKKILEDAGYDVQMAPNPTRWSKQNDLWELWDLVGINRTSIRFIQVKTNYTAKPEWIERAKEWVCPSNCSKELWIFKDGTKAPIIKNL